jgi:hypothetical protein
VRAPRTIIYDDLFAAQRDEIEPDCQRFDDATAAWEWGLLHCPEKGKETAHPQVFAHALRDAVGLPPLIVYYTFNDKYVTLLQVRLADVGDDDDDGDD